MKTPAQSLDLTFDWPRRERFPFTLFLCVFFSLVAHVATFFLFQVIYPQRVTIPPLAPHLQLLTPSSPENEALLRWIDAEDPALVASAPAVLPPGLLEVPYRPSYEIARTAPLGSVEMPVVVQFPAARSPLSIIRSVAPAPKPPARAAVATPTGVSFSGSLRGRMLNQAPLFTFPQRADEPAKPLQALVGVTDRGEVRAVFLQESSGEPVLDTQVLAQLQQLSFSPAEEPIAWGFATVTFGAEAYAEDAPPKAP